jgi:hypothetical protein
MNAILKTLASAAFAASIVAAPIHAQDSSVHVDSHNSIGRIFLTSTQKPQLEVNVGVTRVSGSVAANAINAAPSAFDFTLYPADQTAKVDPQNPNSTIVSFHSHKVEKVNDQTYRASGVLSVTYVVRVASYDPTEAFSGASYGPASTYTVKRGATFEFHPVHHPTWEGVAAYTDWVGTTALVGSYFPELLQSVSNTNWPEVVDNERCTMPATITEAFSGPSCTGDVVAVTARTDVHCEMPANVGAEDFSGAVCDGTPLLAPADAQQSSDPQIAEKSNYTQSTIADEVKITLNLRISDSSYSIAGNSGK